jgi:lipopolysaccharide export system protein LptA
MRALLSAVFLLVLAAVPALAQGAQVAFGSVRADSSLPVEVTADQLRVDQTDGTAIFTGNVVIVQGEMRLSAAEVRVEYAAATETAPARIARMHASGGVVMVSGAEAAEAREAVYSVDDGEVVLTGDVLLTQGANVISGERMVINLDNGTAVVEGRVRTILNPGGRP